MIKYLILVSIKVYQFLLSPLLGKRCRFFPSCSAYAFSAVEKYGWLAGTKKGAQRLLKCHPWHPGGVDYP